MHTGTTHHVSASDPVSGFIEELGPEKRRVAFLRIGEGTTAAVFILSDPAFLDRLSNEADRLCREYVGDVPEPEVEPAGTDCYGSLE